MADIPLNVSETENSNVPEILTGFSLTVLRIRYVLNSMHKIAIGKCPHVVIMWRFPFILLNQLRGRIAAGKE